MSINVSIAAAKGGTGKTTTCWNLGFGLGLAGARVLLIDFDPQDNLRAIAGLDDVPSTVATVIDNGVMIPAELRESVWLLSSGGRRLSHYASSSDGIRAITAPLRRVLNNPHGGFEFDYVLFDCPPEFGRLTFSALALSDYLLIPCISTWLGLSSIRKMVEYIDAHPREAHIESDRVGIVQTFYSIRKSGPEVIRQEAKKEFHGRLFKTLIRERAELDYAQEYHKSIFEYSAHSDGAEDYASLAKELIRRTKN